MSLSNTPQQLRWSSLKSPRQENLNSSPSNQKMFFIACQGMKKQCSNRVLLYVCFSTVSAGWSKDAAPLCLEICRCSLVLQTHADKILWLIQQPCSHQMSMRGVGDLFGWALNQNKEVHCNANDVFGLCHLLRHTDNVCFLNDCLFLFYFILFYFIFIIRHCLMNFWWKFQKMYTEKFCWKCVQEQINSCVL